MASARSGASRSSTTSSSVMRSVMTRSPTPSGRACCLPRSVTVWRCQAMTSLSWGPGRRAWSPRSPPTMPVPQSASTRRPTWWAERRRCRAASCGYRTTRRRRQQGSATAEPTRLTYLDSLSLGMIDPTLVETLIDTGPVVLDWLAESTPLRLQVAPGFPDYHPDHPGAKPHGGRSLDPDLFAFEALGPWADPGGVSTEPATAQPPRESSRGRLGRHRAAAARGASRP